MKEILYHTVHKHNILPLTSRCNTACIFCSNRQNPGQIEVVRIDPLSHDDIKDLSIFLSPDRKIVLGESATRIIEGEPFTHPNITETLSFIRSRFPNTPIQITTNGLLLNPERVRFLKTIAPLEINLSLNTISPKWRKTIMNDGNGAEIINPVRYFSKLGITYHGSIVAMPWLVGWAEIENTISFLNDSGATTVRVFMPGYTKFGPEKLIPPLNLELELREFIAHCRKKFQLPITLEPSGINDLDPITAGIIKGSPAYHAGIEPGDRITSINGKLPFSRAAAFKELIGPGSFIVEVQKMEAGTQKILLNLAPGEKSGLVMDFDLDEGLAQELALQISKKKHTLLLSSNWGAPLINDGLAKLAIRRTCYEILSVENTTFGGNINCAGLLTINDFLKALKAGLTDNKLYDQILLPSIAFDHRGKDILGQHYSELTQEWGVDTKII